MEKNLNRISERESMSYNDTVDCIKSNKALSDVFKMNNFDKQERGIKDDCNQEPSEGNWTGNLYKYSF